MGVLLLIYRGVVVCCFRFLGFIFGVPERLVAHHCGLNDLVVLVGMLQLESEETFGLLLHLLQFLYVIFKVLGADLIRVLLAVV